MHQTQNNEEKKLSNYEMRNSSTRNGNNLKCNMRIRGVEVEVDKRRNVYHQCHEFWLFKNFI